MTSDVSRFSKLYIALKFRLKGLGFYEAMDALELAKDIHDGLRKDGKTPEFQHQLSIAHHAMTLKGVDDLESLIIEILLHDTDEDYPHRIPTGRLDRFKPHVRYGIRLLNKHTHASLEDYFTELAGDMIASMAKGLDRVNNFQTMISGGFSHEKQKKYCHEVITYFLPMLKQARKNFPRQMDAYYQIEFMLKSQLELIQLYISLKEDNGLV